MEFLQHFRTDTVKHGFVAIDESVRITGSQVTNALQMHEHRITLGSPQLGYERQIVESGETLDTGRVPVAEFAGAAMSRAGQIWVREYRLRFRHVLFIVLPER